MPPPPIPFGRLPLPPWPFAGGGHLSNALGLPALSDYRAYLFIDAVIYLSQPKRFSCKSHLSINLYEMKSMPCN